MVDEMLIGEAVVDEMLLGEAEIPLSHPDVIYYSCGCSGMKQWGKFSDSRACYKRTRTERLDIVTSHHQGDSC